MYRRGVKGCNNDVKKGDDHKKIGREDREKGHQNFREKKCRNFSGKILKKGRREILIFLKTCSGTHDPSVEGHPKHHHALHEDLID